MKAGLLAGVATIVLNTGGQAWAQSASDTGNTTTLAPIIVQGNKEQGGTGPVKGYVAKETTTGSKTDTPLKEIPQSVSVVGRQELDDRGVVNKVDEALRYTPGVMAEPFGTDADTDWVYIRGFDATATGVFMDGLNLFSYGFGGFQIDPFMLERVEVLKGPVSVLYGGGNAGGIINYVRKRPTDEPYFYTETGINNFGNAFVGFDISDKLGDSDIYSYRITGKVAGGNNYSDYSEDLRGFIMPQLTIARDDATKLNIWAYAAGLDQTHVNNGFFPYVGTVVNAEPFGKIDRDKFFGEPGIDSGRYNQEMAGYEFEHEFDNGLKFSQTARYGHLYKHEEGPYIYGYNYDDGDPFTDDSYETPQPLGGNQLHRLGFEGTSKVDTFNIDNRLEGEFETAALEHKTLLGIDYKYYRLFNLQASSPATSIDPVNPVYGAAQPYNLIYSNQTVTQHQVGIYAQDQIRFGQGWLVTLNGRYDIVKTDTDNRPTDYPGPVYDYSFNKSALSGRVGVAYEFDNGLTPYASVGTFFNPVVATTATSNNKPEEGQQYEVGIKYDPQFLDGTFTASLFDLTKENVVVSTGAPMWLSSQIGKVNSRGVELEGKINLNENWKVLASYSYTDMEIKDDIVTANIGKRPYLIPESQAALWLDYKVTNTWLEGLSLGAGVRYQGESYADYANTRVVPDVALLDAAIRYEKDGWQASLNVGNVFDKEYVKGCQGTRSCGYGDQRTFTLKLAKTW